MHAVRKNRYVILPKDFEKGYQINVKKPDTDFEFYKWSVLEAHMIIPLLRLLKVIIMKAASGDMVSLNNYVAQWRGCLLGHSKLMRWCMMLSHEMVLFSKDIFLLVF